MVKRFFICLFLFGLVIASVDANVEQYFKKAENKTCQSIRNIDFIYMINLDQRPEKFELSLRQLKPFGIIPYRFSAFNGYKELSIEIINDVGVKLAPGMKMGSLGSFFYFEENQCQESYEVIHQMGRTYFCHGMYFGTIGIVLSHLSVLQDAYDSGYETIWVMEDDIEVIKDPRMISSLIDKLNAIMPNKWDILYTDPDTKDHDGNYIPCFDFVERPNFKPEHNGIFVIRKNFTYDFRKIGARFGAYSMIIKRSGIKKILDYFKTYKIFLPYDMEIPQVPNIRTFTTQEDIVSTLINALSDNAIPFYLEEKSE